MAFQPIYPTLNRRRRETLVPYNQGDQGPFVLDFTTGVFDPRLSFSRDSNATFINSSGYVEWAAANNFTNSTFSGASGTTIPNWSFSQVSGSATVSLSGTELTITCTTATRARVIQNIGTSTGLFVTTQVKVTARSMAFPLNEVLAYLNGSSSDQYKVNGVDRNSTYTGWNIGDVISLTCIPTTGAAAQAVIGIGVSSAQPAGQSITITDVQAEPGTVARTVIPTGQSGSYQAPRFEYLNGVIQGFLVEAQLTNTINWSETFFTATQDPSATFPWAETNITRNSTNNASPMVGLSNALRITASAADAYIRNNPYNMSTDTWTFSIWLRRVSGTGDIQLTVDGGANWTTQTITSSWVRYSLTATGSGWVGVKIVNSGDSIELWGAQRETRPTATSYIPAGRSTATRAADYCRMPTSSFIFGSPSKITMFVETIPNSNGISGGATTYPDYVRLFDRVTNFGYGLELYGYGASTLAIQRKVTASTTTDRLSNSGLAYNTRHKFALSVDSGGFFGSADGVSGASATTAPAAFPASVTHLGVGCNGDASPALVMFGILRYIRIWPYAFSQAALNELTTL